MPLGDASHVLLTLLTDRVPPELASQLRSKFGADQIADRNAGPGRARLRVSLENAVDRQNAIAFLRGAAAATGLSYAILPERTEPHRFRLALLDMDSTLIEQEVIEELAAFAGMREPVARITTLAMEGKLDFQQALRERVKTLTGQPASILDTVFEKHIWPTPGAEEMMAGFHARGIKVGVVSGGFHPIVDRMAQRLGLDYWRANTLDVADGKLTGEVLGEIVDGSVKLATLRKLCADLGCSTHEAIAIGDGANDLPMVREAGLGVAFCAKPIVREQALAAVTRRRLDDVLRFLED